MSEENPSYLVPMIVSGTPCVICGRQAQDRAHIRSRAQAPDAKFDPANIINLCRECHNAHDNRKEFEWERDGNHLLLTYANGSQSRLPIVYSDPALLEVDVREWVQDASLDDLSEFCHGLDAQQAMADELRLRISAELHKRMGGYGERWADHAAQIVHRRPATIRQYAFIWENLGEYLAVNPNLIHSIGTNLLRIAAVSEEPEDMLNYLDDQRHSGKTVHTLLAEQTDCTTHEYRCKKCGALLD